MTRRTFLLRSWALALIVSAIAAVNASAQGPYPCKCDFGTIYGSDKLTCKLEVCVKTPNSWDCYVIGPGSIQQFKCDKEVSIFIKDCKGILHQVTEKCTDCICISDKCFVQACLGYDEKGCLVVKVFPC